MGTPFRIPKKKHLSDSSRVQMMSPLSRVQEGFTSKVSWPNTYNGRRPQERSCVNGREETRPGSTGADRWRPKRASDTLCAQEGDKDTPAVKKQWRCGPADTQSSQSEEEEESPPAPVPTEMKKPSVAVGREHASRSLRALPPKTQIVGSRPDVQRTRPSPAPDAEAPVPKKPLRTPEDRAAPSLPVRKAGCDGTYPTKRLQLQLSYKTYQRIKSSSIEPIVLSSDDEEEGRDEGRSNGPKGSRTAQARISQKACQDSCAGGQRSTSTEESSLLELAFTTLHFDSMWTHANGSIKVTEDGIRIPLKGVDGKGEVEVAMVSSELHGYGVWDGALARDGTLLTDLPEPSPSLLFLAISYAQARLLQTELSAIYTSHADKPCPYVLVVLSGQLDDLQHSTLVSLVDVMGLRCERSSLATPLPWAEGLRRLRNHPHGTRLLSLLDHAGHASRSDTQHTEGKGTKEEGLCKTRRASQGGGASEVTGMRHATLRSRTRQQTLPRRLIQYPPPPSKGGITVTTEDLECLRDGEFLNDVIIDFYLKYLHLERADGGVADRAHIFSSFFYKQLTRKSNSSEEEAGGTAQYRRHRRVKTWTRHVDIFSKDYLFIPVNQEAHWYLVVICFPGLLQTELVPFWRTPSDSSRPTSRPSTADRQQTGSADDPKCQVTPSRRPLHDLPDCTVLTCQKKVVTRRPCILIMDSLKLSYHYGIYTLLREYLQVEWEVRRGTPRAFSDDVIKGSHCKVPLQDNSSDCGLYLLQYVESFLQNPVVHFELPLRLDRWFPRQQVRRKREEIRELVLQLYRRQGGGAELSSS